MDDALKARFGEAMALVSIAALWRGTARSRSSWEKYLRGERRITPDAARELAAFLRDRSASLTEAAEALEKAIADEEGTHG